MVWLLIRDMARRKWKVGLYAIFQMYFFPRMLLQIWPSLDLLAWPMAGSWFLRSFTGLWSNTRVITQLPVSRRDLWRASWLTAILAAPLAVQVSFAIARWSLRSDLPQLEPTIVSIFWSFLYCGLNMAIQRTRYGTFVDAPAAPGRAFVTLGMVFPIIALQFGSPFIFAKYLPHHFSQFGPTTLATAALMCAATVWSFLYEPAIVARPSFRPRNAAAPAAARSNPTSPLNFGDRLTGLRLLFWRTLRRELMIYSFLLAAALIAALMLAPDFREALRIGGALPFSDHPEKLIEPMVYGALLTFTAMADILTAPQLRPLRALPLSTSRLAALPLLLGVISAMSLWTVLLVVHLSVLSTDPVSLRFDLFLAVAGTLTLMRATRLALPGSQMVRHMAAMAPMFMGMLIILPASEKDWTTAGPAMIVTGLSLMIMSFFGMRWSVQRSQSVYRSVSTPVRM
jgi:hypothetical protein